MTNKGVLSKNYYIDSVVVADFGTSIYNMMAEADQAMVEASEIIADIASLTERIPSQIRSNELLEACASAQAEIKSVDFLSYGQKVDQGLQNLLDHNQYITEHFIKNMGTHTEKMRGLGEEFRRLSELITYSGESMPLKGIAFSAVSNTETTNTDGEDEHSSNQEQIYMSLWAALAAIFNLGIEEVEKYINNVMSGKDILSDYMVAHGIGSDEEIEDFTNWILVRRPDLLLQLYDSNNNKEEVERLLDEIFNEITNAQNEKEDCDAYMDIYNKYRIEQGVIVFIDFFLKNKGNLINVKDPKLMVAFLRLFYSDDLIDLYGIEDELQLENSCQDLINNYLYARRYSFRGQIFYTYTWMQINSIENFTNNNIDDADFDARLAEFVNYYNEYKDVYIDIAKEIGIPPQLIAVIHYRENPQDFKDGTFGIRLHDGHSLNEPYTYLNDNGEEETITFNSFKDAAIHAIQLKQYCIDVFNLSYDTTDVVAMVCFAEAYNGMGYYNNNLICPYSFSGTDVYVSGKYTSNGHYDKDTIDQQVGTYRLLLASVAGIYDAEDGKNYVNQICGGYIQ